MSQRNAGRLLGGMFAVVAGVFLALRLGRPALWLDECASVLATQRSWGGLFNLFHGADSPLVPYYALLKLATGGFSQSIHLDHPEVLYRWPSVAALSVATGLLVAWTARRSTPALAASAGALLLTTAGVSRFGQEARPYAFSLLLAVVATCAWARLIDTNNQGGRRWLPVYALSVFGLVLPNVFTATLVVAHGVAALVVPLEGSRVRALVRTAVGAAIGLAVASPLVILTARHGTGAQTNFSPSLDWLWEALSGLFTDPSVQPLAVSLVVVLAGVGLTLLGSETYAFVARVGAAWAVAPLLVILPVVLAQPGLLRPRYLLFVLPGWAIMAGLGVVAIATTVGRALSFVPSLAPAVAVVAAVAVLGGVALTQVSSLREVRQPDGHGENARPIMAWAVSPENAELPILIGGRASVFLAAYEPQAARRLVGVDLQRTQAQIWPTQTSPEQQTEALRGASTVLLLRRATSDRNCNHRRPGEKLNGFIDRCLPAPLPELGFEVAESRPSGRNWVVAVLDRKAV